MEKGSVFTFTAPNGVEVTGVCIALLESDGNVATFLCYAQNRLFTMLEYYNYYYDEETCQEDEDYTNTFGEVLVEYAILPDYDSALASYIQK